MSIPTTNTPSPLIVDIAEAFGFALTVTVTAGAGWAAPETVTVGPARGVVFGALAPADPIAIPTSRMTMPALGGALDLPDCGSL